MFEAFERLPENRKEKIISVGIKEFSEKSYKDVSTDTIIKKCDISKGSLFHYFGSKKYYYIYCLNKSMERLISYTGEVKGTDFYRVLFDSMNRKISLCTQYSDEMHMVNMASRDPSVEIAHEKSEIIGKYMAQVRAESIDTLKKALSTLKFKSNTNGQITAEGLHIYINAVLNRYLVRYQQTPDEFFKNSETIKNEMKAYLDIMLYGVCDREEI